MVQTGEGHEAVPTLCRLFVFVDVCIEYCVDAAPGVFLFAYIRFIYVLYRMGRGRPLYAGGGEDPAEICRDCDRSDFGDALADRGHPFHADARFAFLIEE